MCAKPRLKRQSDKCHQDSSGGVRGQLHVRFQAVVCCGFSLGSPNCLKSENSRRLVLSISKNSPHGRWGHGPKVPGRFAFPGAPNPGIYSISRFEKNFQQFSRDFPAVFLENPQTDPGDSHSLLEFSDQSSSKGGISLFEYGSEGFQVRLRSLSDLVSRGRCGREIARLRRLAAVVAAIFLRF